MQIITPLPQHYQALLALAKTSFLAAHAHSADESDINIYLANNYNFNAFKFDIESPNNHYKLLLVNNEIVAYTKLVLNADQQSLSLKPAAKLDRIYVHPQHFGKGYAQKLLKFNVELAKANGQKGIWLATWVENHRAIGFYKKAGFEIIGAFDFKISEKHVNPNHIFFLAV